MPLNRPESKELVIYDETKQPQKKETRSNMHKPFTVSKKPSVLALPAPEPLSEKPIRPVNMDRMNTLSKPKLKASDPSIRTGPVQTKRLPRINSKSRLLENRVKKINE